jgi:hypothetical protein
MYILYTRTSKKSTYDLLEPGKQIAADLMYWGSNPTGKKFLVLSPGLSGRGVAFTSQPPLLPRLGISEAIPLLPNCNRSTLKRGKLSLNFSTRCTRTLRFLEEEWYSEERKKEKKKVEGTVRTDRYSPYQWKYFSYILFATFRAGYGNSCMKNV